MLRIPHCLDNRLTDGGKVVSHTHRSLLYSTDTLILCFKILKLEIYREDITSNSVNNYCHDFVWQLVSVSKWWRSSQLDGYISLDSPVSHATVRGFELVRRSVKPTAVVGDDYYSYKSATK
jgi:hypothetical protein